MKVLGFDIGIKNLSYCVLNEHYDILHWGIINVLDHEITSCCVCDKPAKYKEEKYFCGRHKTKTSIKLVFKKVSDLSLFDLQTKIIQGLDKHKELLDVDYIVLENQPRFNIKMKTIASALYTYFLIRCKIDNNLNLNHIHYIHPNDKIKKIDYTGPEYKSQKKTKYEKDKDTSIVYCKYLIKDDEKNLNFLLSQNQKIDDLTDSYLTARSYLYQLKKKDYEDLLNTKTLEELQTISKNKNISVNKKIKNGNLKLKTKKQLINELIIL